jgi:hypothetical protein
MRACLRVQLHFSVSFKYLDRGILLIRSGGGLERVSLGVVERLVMHFESVNSIYSHVPFGKLEL